MRKLCVIAVSVVVVQLCALHSALSGTSEIKQHDVNGSISVKKPVPVNSNMKISNEILQKRLDSIEREQADAIARDRNNKDKIIAEQKEYYSSLTGTLQSISNLTQIIFLVVGGIIALLAFLGIRDIRKIKEDAKGDILQIKAEAKESVDKQKEIELSMQKTKVELNDMVTQLQDEKAIIEVTSKQLKAQLLYTQGADILSNKSASQGSIEKAIALLKDSIAIYSHDIARIYLAIGYKNVAKYRDAFEILQNVDKPDDLSPEGAANLLECAVLIDNKIEFVRIDGRYRDALVGFCFSMFLPLMRAVAFLSQANISEMQRCIDECDAKYSLALDEANRLSSFGGKLFDWNLHPIRKYLQNNHAQRDGYSDLEKLITKLERDGHDELVDRIKKLEGVAGG